MVAFTDFSSIENSTDANLASVNDSRLVQCFNTGDEAAFTEIVSRYHGQMVSVAFALLHNRAEAEAIADATFVHARRSSLAKFPGDCPLSLWLQRSALNLARHRHWHGLRDRHDFGHALDLALGHDAILSRRTILNCSYREIARTFGINVGLVKRRIARAREHLRTQLAPFTPAYASPATCGEWADSSRPSGHCEQISA